MLEKHFAKGGQHTTEVAFALPAQLSWVRFSVPPPHTQKKIEFAEMYRQCSVVALLRESGKC